MPEPTAGSEARLAPPSFSRERRVRILSTKYDGSLHYEYDAYLVDVTGALVRCWVDEGTPWISYRGEGVTRHQETALFFTDRWYNVRHSHRPLGWRQFHTYVKITLPARFDGDTIRWVDLDIDVIRDAAGVVIDDEDEFAEHRARMGYPDDLVEQVLRTTAEVTRMVHGGVFPFDRPSHIPPEA